MEVADMKKFVFFLSLILVVGMLTGCASKSDIIKKIYRTQRALTHIFPTWILTEMIWSDWTEFKDHFPQAPPEAFQGDRSEWRWKYRP